MPRPPAERAAFPARQSNACSSDHRCRARLAALTQAALDAACADDCFIAWQDGLGSGLVRAPSAPARWAALESAVMSLAGRRPPPADPPSFLHISAAELAAICDPTDLPVLRPEAFIGLAAREGSWMLMGLIINGGQPSPAIKAVLALLAGNGAAMMVEHERRRSLHFWRSRAMEAARALQAAGSQGAARERERERIEKAAARAAKLRGKGRLAALGRIAAELGGFQAWCVATERAGALELEQSSEPAFGETGALDRSSAMHDSLRRQAVIARSELDGRGGVFREDRRLAERGYRSYLCLPFARGVIALAGRAPLEDAARARVEALVARTAQLVENWMLEEQVRHGRVLARNLALRMLRAAEAERARIARDLHDDNAQLLAAARLALRGRRAQAEAVFKRLEAQLRQRVRELRPATLGRASLARAIESELGRLSAAGIKTAFVRGAGLGSITRPIQQVCFQVVREAFTNVLRHARVARVEVQLGRAHGSVRLEVTSRGAARAPGAREPGVGLLGLRERVELLGGRLGFHLRAGAARLVAEIPEPGK